MIETNREQTNWSFFFEWTVIVCPSGGYPEIYPCSTLDFKGVSSCLGAAGGSPTTASGSDEIPQQFNIFPAIFSRQLNFSNPCPGQNKMMDELRPNLVGVGNLLGVSGLLDEHHLHPMGADKSGRKCNTSGSSAEDFTALYGGLQHSDSGHHGPHTPAHTPPAATVTASRGVTDHTGIYRIGNSLKTLYLRRISFWVFILSVPPLLSWDL